MPISPENGEPMPVSLTEREHQIPAVPGHHQLLRHVSQLLDHHLDGGKIPIRAVITASDDRFYHCEVGTLAGSGRRFDSSIFEFVRRQVESADAFNAVLLVPTGIGAEIGGHAGDATPVAALLASLCDTLITHPNVVNASDIIDIPSNALYVEGSVISRLLMGAVGLQKVRRNRLLVILGCHDDDLFLNAAINSVNAARSSYGLICPRIVQLDSRLVMGSHYTSSGRAAGDVEGVESLFEVLDQYSGEYDAVAITSQISVPTNYHQDYFDSGGNMVNPWGGVEAMLTHAVSSLYNVPSAHSPMLESQEIANADPGVVDPRMAAEAVSLALLQCILKGLQRSPKIISDPAALRHPDVLTVENISCLVIPDGCIGLPTLAALEQGIPVIAVKENRNLMRNDLSQLPWSQGQLHLVENYWEAAGVMAAMQAGIDPQAVRRPLLPAMVEKQASGTPAILEALAAPLRPF
jgi:hypothetical protein